MSREIRALQERRAKVVDQLAKMNDDVQKENRGMTDEERGQWDALIQEEIELSEKIGRHDGASISAGSIWGSQNRDTKIHMKDHDTGKEIRTFDHCEKMFGDVQVPAEYRGVTPAKFIAAAIAGATKYGPEVKRALSDSVDASGGYTVPDWLSSQFVDLLRANSQVLRAGAVSFSMPQGTCRVATLEKDPSFTWRATNDVIPESDPTFGIRELKAKSIGCLVRIPNELVQDTVNAVQMVDHALRNGGGAEIDRGFLLGDKSKKEPNGIINQITNQVDQLNKDFTSDDKWKPLTKANRLLTGGNAYGFSSAIMSNEEWHHFDELADTTGQPLNRPSSLVGVDFLPTSKLDNKDDKGVLQGKRNIVMGDFSGVIVGFREVERIQILRERYADYNQIGILFHMRVDVVVTEPPKMAKIINIGAVPAPASLSVDGGNDKHEAKKPASRVKQTAMQEEEILSGV